MSLVYLNGKLVPKEEARISVFDHGFLYGDGVFEGIRAYNGRVFRLEEHVDRLYASAKAILLNLPLQPAEMEEAILETCRRNNLIEAYIRVVVSRGDGDLGLDPRKCPRPNIIIIADRIALFPPELYATGMKVITVATRRNLSEGVNPRIKSLNYLNNILAKLEANQAGYSEVLMLNQEGYVVEGTGDNVFIVDRRGALLTPPSHAGILEGITRNAIMGLAAELGVRVEERLFTRYDVHVAREVFLTGTAAEAIPVIEVDGRVIGDGVPGPLTRRLIAAYRDLTHREGAAIWPETLPQAAAL
ncbi:MAG: branched-chain-amino-acid transaminase [Bacillota bacterium]